MKGGIIYNNIAYPFDGSDPYPLIDNLDGTKSRKEPETCPFCGPDGACGREWCPYTKEQK